MCLNLYAIISVKDERREKSASGRSVCVCVCLCECLFIFASPHTDRWQLVLLYFRPLSSSVIKFDRIRTRILKTLLLSNNSLKIVEDGAPACLQSLNCNHDV